MTGYSRANGSSNDDAPSRVRVVARIRPLSKTELKRGSKETVTSMQLEPSAVDNNKEPEMIETKADGGNNKRWFELDAVFDSCSTQEEVYERSGARNAVCEDIFKGYNATILAYGQTGAGKTHTMGTASSSSSSKTAVQEKDGMIPRACADLFRNVQEKCDGNAVVELSYMEIYNEEVRDLLVEQENPPANTKQALKIRETLQGEVYVSGLAHKPVTSPHDVGVLMEQAASRRVVASTAMNAVSSRPHAICTLKVSGVMANDNKFTAKLTLVDLAGSERIKKTGAAGSRRQEGISINKGLFVLGQVVSALSEAGSSSKRGVLARRPPYRDSKLTRLLQDSLGGNSRTIMVACVSPADFNLEESTNTLRYATSARKIQTKATRNIVQTITPEEAAALRRENQLLKNQVAEMQQMIQRLSEQAKHPMDFTSLSSTHSTSTVSSSDEDDNSLTARPLDTPTIIETTTHPHEPASSSLIAEAAIELPALKVEVQLLKEKVAASQIIEENNLALRQELDEARTDADSARNAAAKLSGILDHLKGLRRDEIDKKKEELKIMKKDEAWVLFMGTLLDGRAEQMKGLVRDFAMFKSVVMGPTDVSAQIQEKQNSWWVHSNSSGQAMGQEWSPGIRQSMIEDHIEYFLDRLQELQDGIKEECRSLSEMRGSIVKECRALQEEIGKEELEEGRLERCEDRADILEKLKDVLASNRSPCKRDRKACLV